jgi:hypothetical protein
MARRRIVLVDADMLAGWRRPLPSFAQLREALADLRRQQPEVAIAVVADPSLKWDLPEHEQDAMEEEVRTGRMLYAPAGCAGGQLGFLAHVADVARRRGLDPVVVTDQLLTGAPIARVRRDGPRWIFDLDASAPTVVAATGGGPTRRRRRRPGGVRD